MLTVHHLETSRSQRILWLLEELGQPYEVKRYERDPKTMLAPPELLAVHPLGKSPVITDGDITYPDDPVPFAVLWVVPGETTTFSPRYGRVVTMPKGHVS